MEMEIARVQAKEKIHVSHISTDRSLDWIDYVEGR